MVAVLPFRNEYLHMYGTRFHLLEHIQLTPNSSLLTMHCTFAGWFLTLMPMVRTITSQN